MKKILLSISLLALAYTASANVPVIKSDPKIEAQVEQTLKKLTLEEKIGQMMELVTDLFGANDKNGVFYIDEPRFYLYTGRNPLPAEHQCGCHL